MKRAKMQEHLNYVLGTILSPIYINLYNFDNNQWRESYSFPHFPDKTTKAQKDCN